MKEFGSKIRILIVEDEIILAEDISLRLSDANYEVVGIADSAEKAIHLLSEIPRIDLLLLDIMLKGDRDGIALAEEVNKTYQIPLIFLTSHADVGLIERAKKVHPSAYLLKPFNNRQIAVAIELALVNFSKQSPEKELLKTYRFSNEDNAVLKIKDSLFLKRNNRFEKVLLDEIQFLEADNNYTTIHTKENKFVYATVLKKLEQQLPPERFLRVHRSYIVNIHTVNGFEGNILFIDERKIPVSKSNRKDVFNLFRTI